MRVVLDTNVVLSSLLFAAGRLAVLRGAWRDGVITPLVSQETAAELMRALSYPRFGLGAADRHELLADYLPFCESVARTELLQELPECRDPGDVPFLALAVAGEADLLVTGDRDLLDLASSFTIPIVTPAALVGRLGGGTRTAR